MTVMTADEADHGDAGVLQNWLRVPRTDILGDTLEPYAIT